LNYFAFLAVFLARALDLITDAALYARLTSFFFATGDDFIVRTKAMRKHKTKRAYTSSRIAMVDRHLAAYTLSRLQTPSARSIARFSF